MKIPRTPAAAPRGSTLVLLIAAVASAHLVLLLGPPGWAPAQATGPVARSAAAEPLPGERHNSPGAAPPVFTQPMARVSTVRWIVPAPAADSPAARLVSPLPRPADAARSTTPATGVRAAAPRASPPAGPLEALAPAPGALEPEPPDIATPPDAALEPLQSAAREPSQTPLENADDTSLAPPDSELLAAAAEKRDPPAPAASLRELPPAQPPASTRLDYAVTGRIKGIAYTAEGKLDWTLADGRYSARMEMRVLLLGSRVQTSTGRVGAAGLIPERFADRGRGEKAAHFDSEQNRIRFSNNAPDAALQPGAQDRLSLFLQLAGLLQARPQAFGSGQTIEMQVAGTGDADIWRFEVGDEVTLSLPAGEVRARQLRRLPRKAFDSTVEIWLAPALQHLPVRLRVTQANGDVADQQISRMP